MVIKHLEHHLNSALMRDYESHQMVSLLSGIQLILNLKTLLLSGIIVGGLQFACICRRFSNICIDFFVDEVHSVTSRAILFVLYFKLN